MLSRWKKDYRDGRLKPDGMEQLPKALRSARNVQKLQRKVRELEAKVQTQTRVRDLERRYEALRVENDLLKKAIRFNLERRRRSSNS
jgi:hypothetical protein